MNRKVKRVRKRERERKNNEREVKEGMEIDWEEGCNREREGTKVRKKRGRERMRAAKRRREGTKLNNNKLKNNCHPNINLSHQYLTTENPFDPKISVYDGLECGCIQNI